MARISWDDYSLSGEGAAGMEKSTYYIGRVVEETNISYRTMGLTAISTGCREGFFSESTGEMVTSTYRKGARVGIAKSL